MTIAATVRKYVTKIFSPIYQSVRSSSSTLADETTKTKPLQIIPKAYHWKTKYVSYHSKHSFAYPNNVFPHRFDGLAIKSKQPEIIPNSYHRKTKYLSYHSKHSFAYPNDVFPDRFDVDQLLNEVLWEVEDKSIRTHSRHFLYRIYNWNMMSKSKRLTNCNYLNEVLHSFNKLGLHENALVYFRFVYLYQIHGLYTNVTLKRLMHAYSRLGQAKKGGLCVIAVGLKLGLDSNQTMYSYLADCLVCNDEFLEAYWFYANIIDKDPDERQMEDLYSRIVSGLIRFKEIKKALHLIEEMTSNHVFPNLSIFIPVFKGLLLENRVMD
ncbi:hypothetical protein Tco_1454961, partial [Tanacetum coccineum]